jgi:hypothetical protein
VGDGLAARGGVTAVIEQEVDEILRLLAGDGGEDAKVHQQGAFEVEQRDPPFRQAERKAEGGGRCLTHGSAEADVAILAGRDIASGRRRSLTRSWRSQRGEGEA